MLSASAHLCVILDNVQHALWLLWTLPHPHHIQTHPVNPQALDQRIYLLRSYYYSLALSPRTVLLWAYVLDQPHSWLLWVGQTSDNGPALTVGCVKYMESELVRLKSENLQLKERMQELSLMKKPLPPHLVDGRKCTPSPPPTGDKPSRCESQHQAHLVVELMKGMHTLGPPLA